MTSQLRGEAFQTFMFKTEHHLAHSSKRKGKRKTSFLLLRSRFQQLAEQSPYELGVLPGYSVFLSPLQHQGPPTLPLSGPSSLFPPPLLRYLTISSWNYCKISNFVFSVSNVGSPSIVIHMLPVIPFKCKTDHDPNPSHYLQDKNFTP